MTVRTQEEIVLRFTKLSESGSDPFGFERGDLIERLEYCHAKPYLNDGVSEEEWEAYRGKLLPVRAQMIDYMPFAWEKANNERGLSAYRSLAHYTSWLWLDGDEQLCTTLSAYNDYGRPQLVDICKYLGIDWEPFLLSK